MLVPDDPRTDAVARWQEVLVHLGYDLGGSLSLYNDQYDGTDGQFGPRTITATAQFQDDSDDARLQAEHGSVGVLTLLEATERLQALHERAMVKVDEQDIVHRRTLAEASRLLRDALSITAPDTPRARRVSLRRSLSA